MSLIDWPNHKKNHKTLKTPQYKSIHFNISLPHYYGEKKNHQREKEDQEREKKTFKIIINLLWRQPVWAANNASSTHGHVNSYFKC